MNLGGDKWLEQLRADLRRYAASSIGDADLDHLVRFLRCRDDELAPIRLVHGLDSVTHQIEQHLLDLHLVGKHKIDTGIKLEAYTHAPVFRTDERESAGLLHKLFDVFHSPLALTAGDEVAQAANDLTGA